MTIILTALLGCSGQTPTAEAARATVGKPAPDFTLPATDGTKTTLSEQKGKTVVLEWFNPGCPFVVAAHEPGGPLAKAPAEQPDDVVWLAINSGAPGKQGHGVDTNTEAASTWGMEYPVLLDESGEVGKAYGATNTPQMVVIDPEGTIRYWGALDNAPRGAVKGKEHIPYTMNALAAVRKGTQPEPDETKPWGCSVKY